MALTPKPLRFQVIDGGAQRAPPSLALRPQVIARSPFDRSEAITFRLSKLEIQKRAAARRAQPVFEAWSVVIGEPPPVNNISKWDERLRLCPLVSLADAIACFRGVKRPVAEDDTGWDTLAYVIRPEWYFAYQPSLACVAELTKVPADLVFVTYVRLDQPFGEQNARYSRTEASGVITHWHFVEGEADSSGQLLPVGHPMRYRTRLW